MFRLKDVSPKPPAQCYLPQLLILSLHYIYYVDKKTNVCKCRVLCLSQRCMLDAGVVGQLAALLVPGAGHRADAEVVQDAAPALHRAEKSLKWAPNFSSVFLGSQDLEAKIRPNQCIYSFPCTQCGCTYNYQSLCHEISLLQLLKNIKNF